MQEMIRSTRFKLAVFGLVTAFVQRYAPDFMPSEDTMNYLYGLLIALIAGDTVRPINAEKKGLFQDLGNSINDGLKNAAISTTVETSGKESEKRYSNQIGS